MLLCAGGLSSVWLLVVVFICFTLGPTRHRNSHNSHFASPVNHGTLQQNATWSVTGWGFHARDGVTHSRGAFLCDVGSIGCGAGSGESVSKLRRIHTHTHTLSPPHGKNFGPLSPEPQPRNGEERGGCANRASTRDVSVPFHRPWTGTRQQRASVRPEVAAAHRCMPLPSKKSAPVQVSASVWGRLSPDWCMIRLVGYLTRLGFKLLSSVFGLRVGGRQQAVSKGVLQFASINPIIPQFPCMITNSPTWQSKWSECICQEGQLKRWDTQIITTQGRRIQ